MRIPKPKKVLMPIAFLLVGIAAFAQEKDSIGELKEIRIRAFEQYRPPNTSTAPIRIIGSENSDRNNKTSLVHSFNSIAGVRMEERSPGSYRINIRGSSLRSPFGVRNIKVYWNDIPITDAGGNTYFNQFAWNNFSQIELFKGPASSLYGAGTGGLLLMHSHDDRSPGIDLEYMTGSYNLHNIFLTGSWGRQQNSNKVTYAHNQSDGYRRQSAMRRDNFSWSSKLHLNDRQQLTASILYTNLYYQTPGGLTLAEYEADPRAARPAAGPFPGAEEIDAAIRQQNMIAGFSHQYQISPLLRNQTVLYASYSMLKNSAVRNYERRIEPQWGGRSSFTWEKNYQRWKWQWVAGAEFQQGDFNTLVTDNVNGNPGPVQTNDDVGNQLFTAFLQTDFELPKDWIITAGASINRSRVVFRRLSDSPVLTQSRRYQNELAPRLAILKKLAPELYVLGSVARGFSPPTTAELLPSTGVISTFLDAEQGWNYELSVRYNLWQRQLQLEATAFFLNLDKALVQARDAGGADYFVNAGRVHQKGLEAQARFQRMLRGSQWLRSLVLQADLTLNQFRYRDYEKDNQDYSGNRVPSVPARSFSFLADLSGAAGWYSQLTYYAASSIFLNDANSAKAGAYHLLGWRLGWKTTQSAKNRWNLYVGVDNLLNEGYSLGNDINAAAGRYYNAAAGRNYYAGIAYSFHPSGSASR